MGVKNKKHNLKEKHLKNCLINKDNEVVLNALNDLFGKLFFYKKDVIFVDIDNYAKVSEKDLKNILSQEEYKNIFWRVVYSKKGKEPKKEWLIDVSMIYTMAKFNKIDNIKFKGVVFENEGIFYDEITNELVVKRNNLKLKPFRSSLDEKIKKEIINDYLLHFPLYHEFLDFIVAVRFTGNRKRSFLYLNAPSDWGKSFVMAIFKDFLGLGMQIDYSVFITGRPKGVNAMSVFKSLVLFLDEFTTFKKEMKNATHSIRVEEKFESEVEIDVYAKVLMSAEKSPSFSDTVETQIQNRVLFFNLSKSKEVLTKRELYLKYGDYAYKEAVAEYTYYELKKRIDYYLKLGKFNADKEAEKKINELYNKYKINEIDLETYLIKFFADELSELVEEKLQESNVDFDFDTKRLLKYVYVVGMDTKRVLINNFTKFVDDLFKIKLDETKQKSANYKKTQLANILFETEKISDLIKQKKVNGKNKKVIDVYLPDLYFRYLKRSKILELQDKKIEFNTFKDLAQKINDYVKDLIEQGKKTNEVKETLENWGLSSVFVFVVDKNNNFLGVELKETIPNNNDQYPF